jgi:hypothetical protein
MDHEANVRGRPTEMLERQLLANRKAARERFVPNTRRKTFQHILPYRPHFVREILWMRDELRRRRFPGDNDAG